ncbi:hypothetical protein L195_g025150 [Trifolium pratense]|uniref:Uncharacterized protein n=1 Tax=Trifolium pratense TaxID=57577 RepID=A0A2K3NFP4_TRIPR|nr:hypothetical protein L195_g025150 [Trifolium pratense]
MVTVTPQSKRLLGSQSACKALSAWRAEGDLAVTLVLVGGLVDDHNGFYEFTVG